MADYTLSVKITGDASGLEKAAQTAQSKLSTIGKGIGEVGQGLTNKITKPALGAATAVAGITIGKGFSRMIEIDNARAKLQALGMDADAIKDSARLAVEDTAFSLNKAMTTAASAAAAGIQPGEQMTKYLTAIADAAAVAGTDMDEMGAIFNKVATNGKISAEEINQLSDRGIPAVQLLAKATGKSMEEVREAISNGEIGVEELQEAIEIGMPEAAKAIGSSTISGAFSNFNAAIARVGENLIGSADKGNTFAGRLLPLLNAINGAMGLVETKASELGAKLAESVGPPMDKLTDLIQRFAEGEVKIDAAKAKIAALGSVASVALGPAMVGVSKGIAAFDKLKGAVGTLGNIFGKSSGQILKMGGIIGLVVAAFAIAYTRSESFRDAVNGLVSAIGGALLSVFKALSPIIQTAFGLFAELATTLGTALAPAIQQISPIISRIGTALAGVLSVLSPIIAFVAGIAVKIISFLMPIVTFITATLVGVIRGAITVITGIINAIVGVVTAMGSQLTSIWNAIKATASSVWNGIKTTAATIWNAIKTAVTTPINTAKTLVNNAINTIKSIMGFSGLLGKVQGIFNSIKSAITGPIESAKEKIGDIITKIKNKFPFSLGKIINFKTPSISLSTGSKTVLGKTITYPTGFSVNWSSHAKGGVFSRPTLIPTMNAIHEVGEAGPEAIAPISTLQKYVAQAVTAASSDALTATDVRQAVIDGVQELIPAIEEGLIEAVEGLGISVDGREFGRAIRKAVSI